MACRLLDQEADYLRAYTEELKSLGSPCSGAAVPCDPWAPISCNWLTPPASPITEVCTRPELCVCKLLDAGRQS